ncbi:lipopolysaccharide biosynthesis protein [Microbacterium gubbeenense]|uniref:lipopolysaccharide biosynthesis protein n=1 Tax=Microbacterium gubbeenense TaxID=159896 RepID=UPI003F9A1E4A
MGDRSATAFLLLGQIVAAGAAFLVNLLASSVMAPDSRGTLAFALQISYTLTAVTLMGLERPFIASRKGPFLGQYRVFTELISPGFLLLALITLIALIAVPAEGGLRFLILAMAGYIAGNMLIRGARVSYVTSREWRPFVLTNIASQIAIVIGAALLVINRIDGVVAWMVVYTVSGIIPLGLLMRTLRRHRDQTIRLESDESRSLRLQGIRLLPAALGNTAMVRSDRLLLPILGTPADLGLYVTVATVMEMAVWPVQQWVDVSLRKWARGRVDMRAALRVTLLAASVAGGLAIALGCAAWGVVMLLLPTAYEPATTAIVPLGVASVFYAVTRVQQGLLIASGRPGRASIVETIGWVIAITAYAIFIPLFGFIGAAYGSIIGYVGCAIAGAAIMYSSSSKG